MPTRVPEKIMWLYEHLPDRYIAWQAVEEASIFLNVNPDRARQYLQMLETFHLVRRLDNMGAFEKIQKGQKKVGLDDMAVSQEAE